MILQYLNAAGAASGLFALHMSAQVALLVGILLGVDRLLRDRVRAALRHGLWMLVVVKLLLPTDLLSPTAIAYWVAPWLTEPVAAGFDTAGGGVFAQARVPEIGKASPPEAPRSLTPAPASLRPAGGMLLAWVAGSGAWAFWVSARNRRVARQVAAATEAPEAVRSLLSQTAAGLRLRTRTPQVRLTDAALGPALCGLLQPIILLPRGLVERVDSGALRQVLRHELIHLARRDPWWNLLQVGVQVLWWWNPLVWFVNARIRGLRESAVDEAVMLEPGSDEYPATLVAVARHCATPVRMPLALLGILEARGGLESRVRRLVERPLPRSARLGGLGWVTVLLAGGLLLPMGFARRLEPSGTPVPSTPPPAATIASQGSDAPGRPARGPEGSVVPSPSGASASGPAGPAASAPLVLIEGRFFDVLQSSLPSVGAAFQARTNDLELLTAAEAQEMAKALAGAAGTESLVSPRITTLLGRGAEVSLMSEQPFVSDSTPAGDGRPKSVLTMNIQAGRTLQVLPAAVPGLSNALELQIVATYVDADGVVDAAGNSGVSFRTNQVGGHARLWDGQALLLAAGTRTNRVRFVDKVVPLGDLPLVGRLFRKESTQDRVRHLFVLVQPTLVDASGKPVNDPARPPFDPTGFPPKP